MLNPDRAVIPIAYDDLVANYPRRTSKTGEFGGKLAHPDLRKFMDSIPGTPCCVQVSHAFNMAGHRIPQSYPHARRKNSRIRIDGQDYFYLLAVDEMETYMTHAFRPGEVVTGGGAIAGQRARSVRDTLKDRRGLLVMRSSATSLGVHTEFWDGNAFHQKDMATDALLGLARVVFWECAGIPLWLKTYMGSN